MNLAQGLLMGKDTQYCLRAQSRKSVVFESPTNKTEYRETLAWQTRETVKFTFRIAQQLC